jgi:hypothetical protein
VKKNPSIPFVVFISCLLLVAHICRGQQQVMTQGNVTMFSDRQLNIITARVVNKISGKPAAGIRGYLSVPGQHFEFTTAVSDSTGQLKFLLKHLDRSKPLWFQTDPVMDSSFRIAPDNPFTSKVISDNYGGDTLPFYGTPDITYSLDDYTRFPTMEEVLVEYVAEVKLIKTRTNIRFEVLNTPYKNYFSSNPLVLLDGVPVFNLKRLLDLDPLKIKKLEVMACKYYYGSASFNGIVSFITYEGDLAGYEPGDNLTVETYTK